MGPPYSIWSNSAICFKFDTDIEDAILRRFDHKMTTKWALPPSRDPISISGSPYKFWMLSASSLVTPYRTDLSYVWTIKLPLSERGLHHVTQIINFGTPYNFGITWPICFRFGTEMADGYFLRMNLKMTTKWARPGSSDPISNFWDPPYNWQNIKGKLAYMYINDNKTANTKGKN